MSMLLIKQFEISRQGIFQDVDGLSSELFDVQPNGLPNTLRWQLGHVLTCAELFLFGPMGELPATYNQWFGYGSKPSAWQGDVPSVETLVKQLKEQLERIKAIPTERFQDNLPEPILGNTTFGELVNFTASHETNHAGQIHVIKKLVI